MAADFIPHPDLPHLRATAKMFKESIAAREAIPGATDEFTRVTESEKSRLKATLSDIKALEEADERRKYGSIPCPPSTAPDTAAQ